MPPPPPKIIGLPHHPVDLCPGQVRFGNNTERDACTERPCAQSALPGGRPRELLGLVLIRCPRRLTFARARARSRALCRRLRVPATAAAAGIGGLLADKPSTHTAICTHARPRARATPYANGVKRKVSFCAHAGESRGRDRRRVWTFGAPGQKTPHPPGLQKKPYHRVLGR